MAIYSSTSTTNWTLSLKLLLISTGVLSVAFAMKLSVPVVTDFVASEVPSICSVVLSWLRPPYLYILINCIIISIVASSKLQQKVEYYPAPPEMVVPQPQVAEAVKVSGSDVPTDYAEAYGGAVLTGYGYDANAVAKVYDGSSVAVAEDVQRWAGVVEKTVSEVKEMVINDRTVAKGGDDVAVVSASVGNGLQRKDSLEVLFFSNGNEKPPVSARFGQRKAVKASPEGGKSLGVSKPKRHETLESTWKTITEGRSMPLTRHLKKCDTWESHARRNMQMEQNTPPTTKLMKKSETFKDHSGTGSPNSTLSPSSSSGKLRKEPSLSQDELNRRVEAFIKKFNEEMRLQRQESLNQYQEMIRRGAH